MVVKNRNGRNGRQRSVFLRRVVEFFTRSRGGKEDIPSRGFSRAKRGKIFSTRIARPLRATINFPPLGYPTSLLANL